MSQLERVYKIDRLLRRRRPPSRKELVEALEVSPATLKRDLEFMRSRLHAPIEWDRRSGGYRYGSPGPGDPEYALPGLWFTGDEIRALLLMDEVLDQLHAGLLREHLRPLEMRLRELLEKMPAPVQDIRRRFRILHAGVRSVEPECFHTVSTATLGRRRLFLRYYTRSRATETTRTVSPQRLIYYRSNWYVEAWCHKTNALRSFALDSIREARVLDRPAREVDEELLDAHVGPGYGIFGGPATEVAVLRFAPEAARWVSKELWHPKQVRRAAADGTLVLEVPYSHPHEILKEVLRHGPDVEVLAPESLRQAASTLLGQALAVYQLAKRPAARVELPQEIAATAGI